MNLNLATICNHTRDLNQDSRQSEGADLWPRGLITPCFIFFNWTLCYFIISLLWQLRTAWQFPEVHMRCCLLWIWN